MNRPLKPSEAESLRTEAITLERAPPRPRWLLRGVLVLLVLLGAGAGGWYLWNGSLPGLTASAPPTPRAGRPGGAPVPVTVAVARTQDVPILLDAIGTVQALQTVTVRAQVDGQLLEVGFTEGQEVKRGDLLARIDPRTYQAALDQAVAKKAQDEALLANARVDLQRYTTLAQTQGVSRQQADTQKSVVAQYEAQVQSDVAAIDNAKTQLSFTTIRAPLEGRVGLRLVDPGNLLRSGDATGIVTIAQLEPIAVVFTLPQQDLPRVQAAMARGPVIVEAAMQGAQDAVARGTLLTIDNLVDAQTGTIKLKASFPNEDRRLWPGAFVTAKLEVDRLPGVTTVPLVAVQRGPDGAYAFVASADGTIEQRPLALGPLTASEAVVRRGVAPGDRVVTSGALRLTAGTHVVAQEEGAAPGNAPPPVPGQRRRPRQAADAKP